MLFFNGHCNNTDDDNNDLNHESVKLSEAKQAFETLKTFFYQSCSLEIEDGIRDLEIMTGKLFNCVELNRDNLHISQDHYGIYTRV